MDVAVMTTLCPYCGHQSAESDARFVQCPKCGLDLPDSTGLLQQPSGAPDEELIHDLREAFDSSETVFSPDSTKPGSESGPPPPVILDGFPDGRFGEFTILSELGRGGMGVVYHARQASLDREVALKILPGAALRIGPSVRRFHNEAKAVARLNHPNVVPVYARGEFGTHVYYAMALIDGCSLDVAIHSKPELLSSSRISAVRLDHTRIAPPLQEIDRSPPDEAPVRPRTLEDFRHVARLVADVADGLAHAHARGVIHRDVKPQNLLLSSAGRIYITDFGLSLLTDEPHITVTGELMGTPSYLSPEQVRGDGKTVDHRTDIYSLGVTLYEVLTGRRPFGGETRVEILANICSLEPIRPRRLDRRLPVDLETICLLAIDKDPSRRYATAALMADDLRRFAEGTPITARRPSPAQRGSRFLRRHRAMSVVTLSLLVTAAVTVGYVANLAAVRQTEADRLLQAAYDQLVYSDYRSPAVVEGIDRAQALGADPVRVNLLRAITSLGASNNAEAAERLNHVLADTPNHTESLYLLSWAQWRIHDRAGARETFDRAESLGGPTTAPEWFFRALAAHFDRPELAAESYARANALRAAEHQFFPQAMLHLARAYNQRMYSFRSREVFEDAQAILQELVRQQHYGSYPHYLLSINQRLYGEVLATSDEPAEREAAPQYFQEALDWARRGQTVDAAADLPITAEAECLEQLGKFPEAVETRSRAIAAATVEGKRCEGYHYRWRLHYWRNNWEGALADISAHAGCVPDSLFYARVYPLWVYAEMGDLDRARHEARLIAEEAPDDALAVLWSATCLRLLGQTQEAADLLDDRRGSVRYSAGLSPPQTAEWVEALWDCAAGGRDRAALLALADQAAEPQRLRAEGHFHLAIQALAEGRRDDAVSGLMQAYRCFDGELRFTFHARTLLVKLQNQPDWPAWLTAGAETEH